METRDSFIFYRSFYEAIKEIPEAEQLKVYKAITEYALNQNEIEIEGVSKAIFTLIRPQLDANFQKYLNGKKSKQNKSKIEASYKQSKSKSETNVNVNVNENVNVNDNDNVNVNVSDSCVDGLQEIIKFYEQNIGLITPHSLEILSDFLSEMQSDVVIFAMQIAVESNARNIAYIKSILNNWSKKGIKTLIEAQEERRKFKEKDKKDETEEEAKKRKLKELEEAETNDEY